MTILLRRALLIATSAIGAFVGTWAALLPAAFYESFPGIGLGPWVAVDGPYNEHLVRARRASPPPRTTAGDIRRAGW